MSPTLLDVVMLTHLPVIPPFNPSSLSVPTHKLQTKHIDGWTGYIQEHCKTGPVGQREHIVFLNLWLERFVFCRSTLGPTSNM